MKSNGVISENGLFGSITSSSFRHLLPRKHKDGSIRAKPASDVENIPPVDPNILVHHNEALPSTAATDKSPSKSEPISSPDVSPLADPAVKVVVRVRPSNDDDAAAAGAGDRTAGKVSSDSVLVGDRNFKFDSVLDSTSTQDDVFRVVGMPLVQNALAGFNTTILSYGQTGSGKTYTMWGPPSAMVEGHSSSHQQGIAPRFFQMLFSEIQREQANFEGKQINYQCRCSFLEVYNEKIGDLIDPTHRNLEIKDDPKNGFYVENLTEEYVTSYEDVIQIMIKGLSSRKVGATSINSKSSQSHAVFTCIVESWCKGNSSNCFSSSKMSRISFVDLAGVDRTRPDGASTEYSREGKSTKKSLSHLGHVVNILSEGNPSLKLESVPYRSSCLTHLLQDSLGGNSKLTVICGILAGSTGETLSTLRFGQRAAALHNQPVINEITEEDVNDLSDQIRQLKEELIRAKSSMSNSVGSSGYFQGKNVRDSLNQFRVRLNRSVILPSIGNGSDIEVNYDEGDVDELRVQLDTLRNSFEESFRDALGKRSSFKLEESCETNLISQHDTISSEEESDLYEANYENSDVEVPPMGEVCEGLSVSSCQMDLQEPTLSESPKISDILKKCTVFSSNFSANQTDDFGSSKTNNSVVKDSLRQSDLIRTVHLNKILPGSTESLAASLQRGLQIIEHHQKQSALNKSTVSFSFEHLTLKPCSAVDKANASVQTLSEEKPTIGASSSLLCASCQKRVFNGTNEVEDSLKKLNVSADEAENHGLLVQVPRDCKNEIAKGSTKEDLETVCMEQAAKIEELNHLVAQYSNERDQYSISAHGQETVPIVNFENEESGLPRNDGKFWGCNYEDQPEEEALLDEIQSRKRNSCADPSRNKSLENLRSSLISRSIQMRKSCLNLLATSQEELDQERQRWTEMESDWISLTDELRIELQAQRQHAKKVEMEMSLEKKGREELDDALRRAVLGHGRMVEHYAELQEAHNDLVEKHRAMMEGIAQVKRAAAKAGTKGHGPRFAKALAAELSALRLERERESRQLKKENKSLRIQLKDTAEAVHAAGELLVRLREAEEAAAIAEDNNARDQQEIDKLKTQLEKAKRKHKMEMITMKQYLAESRLPESALQPLNRQDSDIANNIPMSVADDDQAWRAEFGASYQSYY